MRSFPRRHAFSASVSRSDTLSPGFMNILQKRCAEDHRKEIVEVVRDAARENAQRLELPRLKELFFHPLFGR